jgi:hypothetical protein
MFIGGSPKFVKEKTHRTGGAELRVRWRAFSVAGSRIPMIKPVICQFGVNHGVQAQCIMHTQICNFLQPVRL